jgi:DNA-binding MarR family transcriptional regulator
VPDERGGARAPEGSTANRLGALALAVVDRTSEAIAAAVGHSDSAAAALSVLHHILDRPSIDHLRQVLGLTHSGAVRLVDRLEHDGFVRRRPGPDGRSTAVTLTASGRRAATRVTTARARVLDTALEALAPDEREIFDHLVGRVLVGMMREPGATRWTCRLCDTVACGRYTGDCPIGRAAEARYSSSRMD